LIETVLVTGGCGRLGRYVVDELRSRYRVTTLDVVDSPWTLPHLALDILDLSGLYRACAGQDAVVHLAALDGHLEMPAARFQAVNALGTWNVLEAAFEAGVKQAVVASSNSALGLSDGEGARRPLYIPLDEAHPAWPTQPYALSKRLNEVTAESFGRRNRMRVACIRPTYEHRPWLANVRRAPWWTGFREEVRPLAAGNREPRDEAEPTPTSAATTRGTT
jgi:UDP-glucose 4-epimerase